MAVERAKRAVLQSGTSNPPEVVRVLGVLFLCGAVLAAAQISVADSEPGNVAGLYAIAAVSFVVGVGSFLWAPRVQAWMVHALFAAGSALICLGIFLAGVATGAYAVLFVWLVIMAASFFSARAIAAHVGWILVASAVALASVETSPGVSPATRWVFGSLLLVVAATVMSRIAAGRRAVEQRLRTEIEEKAQLQRELEHLAHHDPLTGLPNRRRLDQELERELARADRSGRPLCVIALDLDGFKAYNDRHGHVAGDRLLKAAAGAWTEALRAVDTLARIGGDEFVVLVPDCPGEDAVRVAQRLRHSIALALPCSAGSALWDRQESAEELCGRADRAMYEAKKRGPSRAIVGEATAAGH